MRRLNKTYPYVKQLKNRSSKNNVWLSGHGTKSVIKSMSNEALKEFADNSKTKGSLYEQELNRRAKKRAKKAQKAS